MGIVYKARHTKLKRLVAIKLVAAGRVRDGHALERFHREMEAVAGLDHPHIVRAHDANELDGEHYLVMEYLDGIDLAQLIQRVGPLPRRGRVRERAADRPGPSARPRAWLDPS